MSQDQPPSSDTTIKVEVGDDEAAIEFPAEGLTTSCPVTKVGNGLYRLDGVPIGSESATYKDVIVADEVGTAGLRFHRVAQASGWRVYEYVLPSGWLDSEPGTGYLAELTAKGIHWERVFGGMLFICIPPGLAFDPTHSIDAAIGPAT